MQPLTPKDPKSIGDYTLIGRLGSGGMGIVYLAANGPDSVALKVIRESLLEDPSQATRFSREIETLKKINSPFVAKIINSGVTEGQAWYATEFVNGPDLKSLVDAKGPLKEDAWMSLAEGLLQGIAAIHSQGIIHRDIKPANVIVAESGPKIIDFGIAQVSDATSVTSTGLVAGTPAWFSPEQIEGKTLTVATDLFSAGSVLTYAATGRSPWGDETTMTKASVYSILVSEPNLSEVTDAQRKIIAPLLNKEPKDRHLPGGLASDPAKGARTRSSDLHKESVTKKVGSARPDSASKAGKGSGRSEEYRSPKAAIFAVATLGIGAIVAGILSGPLDLTGESEQVDDEISEVSSPRPSGPPIEVVIGGLYPQTGFLSFLGPPVEAALLLAQEDINSADLGIELEVLTADSGDSTTDTALASAQYLANSGVSAVVGPLSSSRTFQVLDYLSGENFIPVISPAASSEVLRGYDTNELFFRTIASDSQQATALADLMISDGASEVTIVYVDDPYAFDISSGVVARFEQVLPSIDPPNLIRIDVGGKLSDSQVRGILNQNPDRILVVTFEESIDVLSQLIEAGLPSDTIYLSDGNLADYSEDFSAGYLTGAKGVLPGVEPGFIDPNFYTRLDQVWVAKGNPRLEIQVYAAETYDAAIAVALAALKRNTHVGMAIAADLPRVTGGYEFGKPCYDFAQCATSILRGEEITYWGLTGALEMGRDGISSGAKISVYQYGSDNRFYPQELRTTYVDRENRVSLFN